MEYLGSAILSMCAVHMRDEIWLEHCRLTMMRASQGRAGWRLRLNIHVALAVRLEHIHEVKPSFKNPAGTSWSSVKFTKAGWALLPIA